MTHPNAFSAELERQALAWLARLHDQPSLMDQAAFEHWLAADPLHGPAYTEAQSLWELCEGPAQRLGQEESGSLNALLAAMDAPRRRSLGVPVWGAGLAVAACLLLMVGVGAGWQPLQSMQDLGADYVSRVGEVRTVTLADQSQVTLDANSAIAVHFSPGERHVQVRRGAAFFSVTHTGQPFVVSAGNGEARVLGTRFEVRVEPDGARVTVQQGRVGVVATRDTAQQVLGAGQQVDYRDGVSAQARSVDANAQLAWREGWLNYYQVPLADVVRDLQRYYPGRILLFSDLLGQRRVSGSFPGKDPLAALDSLQAVLGFAEHRLPGGMIVLR